jgi:hypothetical protein
MYQHITHALAEAHVADMQLAAARHRAGRQLARRTGSREGGRSLRILVGVWQRARASRAAQRLDGDAIAGTKSAGYFWAPNGAIAAGDEHSRA